MATVMLLDPNPMFHPKSSNREVYEVSHPDALTAMAQARFQLRERWGKIDEHGRCAAGWRVTYMSDINGQEARKYVSLPRFEDENTFEPDYTTTLAELDNMIAKGEHVLGTPFTITYYEKTTMVMCAQSADAALQSVQDDYERKQRQFPGHYPGMEMITATDGRET